MAVEATFVIRCDRCAGFLYDGDGDLIRRTTNPKIVKMTEAHGWQYMSDCDEHRVARPMICCACVVRTAAMRAWIEQNRADR